MLFFKFIKNKTAITVLFIFAASTLAAQSKAPALAQPVSSGYNQLAILLMILIVVLAFVIWGMGQVLTALGRQLVDKTGILQKFSALFCLQAFLCFHIFHLHSKQQPQLLYPNCRITVA